MTFSSPQSRRAAIIAAMIAAWVLVGVLLATQAWISRAMRGEPMAWGHAAAIWFSWAGIWALLTPLVLRLATRFPLERPHLVRAALLHIVAGLVFAAVNLALFAVIAPYLDAVSSEPTWIGTFSRLLGSTLLLNVPVYWLVVVGAHAVRLVRRSREREQRALRLETQLAEARLLVLRAQLEPHFLFNALNTVSVLMHENVDSANRVLLLLSDLLRRALDSSTSSEIELRQEVAFMEAYLALEQVRFADRMHYRIDIAPNALNLRVPSLILQPLVENAVRHGLREGRAGGEIEVVAALRDGTLQLTVRDNGPGMAVDAREGVGLSNTRSRLQLTYGSCHAFKLDAAPGGGTLVRIEIPAVAA